MRALGASRTSLVPGGALAGGWTRNALWKTARAVPSLDLRFADNKSLVDAVTGASLITFTRASSGTYVDSAGVLQTAAIDVPRFDHSITSSTTNLLQRSEEFDNAYWSASGSTAPTVTANTAISPSGTLTADTITFAAADSRIQTDLIPVTAGVSYTFSVYVKAVGVSLNKCRLAFFDGAQQNSADFTVSNLTWTRISNTFVAANTASARFQIRNATDVLANSLFVWGAQLEQSATVGPYVPTTTAAATSNTTESLGLLVEEQRTNLCLYSQAISTAPWSANSIETCVASTLVDPAGGTSASKINLDASTASRWQQPITVVSGTTYTLSAWVRSTTGTTLFRLRFGGGVTTSDLTATTTWQRFTYTLTASTTAGFFAFNAPSSGAATEIHVYGAQLEAGAFPTSYIPTTTAAATRSADVASITGTAFSGWYNSSASTIYSEAASSSGAAYTGYIYTIGADFNNCITHYRQADFQPVARIRNAGADEYGANGNGAIWTGTLSNKFALAVSSTSGRQASNGSLNTGSDDTSISIPTAASMTIGALVGGSIQLNGTIKRLAYWPQRLPNSTLQQLTQ